MLYTAVALNETILLSKCTLPGCVMALDGHYYTCALLLGLSLASLLLSGDLEVTALVMCSCPYPLPAALEQAGMPLQTMLH